MPENELAQVADPVIFCAVCGTRLEIIAVEVTMTDEANLPDTVTRLTGRPCGKCAVAVHKAGYAEGFGVAAEIDRPFIEGKRKAK